MNIFTAKQNQLTVLLIQSMTSSINAVLMIRARRFFSFYKYVDFSIDNA